MSRAAELDRADPLARFRGEFVVADPDLVYLDGNSLGRMPRRTAEILRDTSGAWSHRLVRGWEEGWIDLDARLGAKLAVLVGAAPEEVTFADSTSVNLYKLATAALDAAAPGRRTIVSDELNFPSDLHVLAGVAARAGGRLVLARSADGREISPSALAGAIDRETALVALSHVAFKSSFRHDLAAVTALAHGAGALVLWDLSHSVGAMPIALGEAGADLAVGCGYKFLNGGPGAPAFLFVRRALHERLRNPIPGWFGSDRPFDFEIAHRAAEGIRRFVTGTPPILSLAAVEGGVDLVLAAGTEAIRRKSVAQTEHLLALADQALAPLGFEIGTPRDPERRGSHVSLRHPEGLRIARAARSLGVLPDFRRPDHIRLGVSPLTTSFVDLDVAVERLARILRDGLHLGIPDDEPPVT